VQDVRDSILQQLQKFGKVWKNLKALSRGFAVDGALRIGWVPHANAGILKRDGRGA
jgi:hypothetical protein